MGKYVVFGAGRYALKAVKLLGKENIETFFDNDILKWGTQIEGISVCSLEEKRENLDDYQFIIATSKEYQYQIIEQLKQWNIKNVRTIQDIQVEFIKKRIQNRINNIKVYEKAIMWITNNSIDNQAIICNTDNRNGYPEVTGYYIPTLLKWGYCELAISYTEWLCSIQKEDGSWFDANDRMPYVFDTAQVLKGLIAIRYKYPQVDIHIKKGCDWILSNMQESGKLITPSKEAWGNGRSCSELVHIYCLSPLVQAANILDMPQYKEAAYKI